eukprot:NODE_426_length_7665_cov_0.708961.p2 type:complete len:219 gc:universal NODE_426_length_7665_cov_0.708961:297-953(+)
MLIISLLFAFELSQSSFLHDCGFVIDQFRQDCISQGKSTLKDVESCIVDLMSQEQQERCASWFRNIASEIGTDAILKPEQKVFIDAQYKQLQVLELPMVLSSEPLIPKACPHNLEKRQTRGSIGDRIRQGTYNAFRWLMVLYDIAYRIGRTVWMLPAMTISVFLAAPFFLINKHKLAFKNSMCLMYGLYDILIGKSFIDYLFAHSSLLVDFMVWWTYG